MLDAKISIEQLCTMLCMLINYMHYFFSIVSTVRVVRKKQGEGLSGWRPGQGGALGGGFASPLGVRHKNSPSQKIWDILAL